MKNLLTYFYTHFGANTAKHYGVLFIALISVFGLSAQTLPSDSSSVTSCDNYVTDMGLTITSSIILRDTLLNTAGMDSFEVITNVVINPFINPVLTVSGPECAPNPSFDFTAASPNPNISTFRWYSQLTGGSFLNAGTSYTSSFATTSSVYVVQGGEAAPMPLQTSLNTGSPTRGYWFVAPNDFVITSLFVPTLDSNKFQNIAVLRMDGNIPPPTASLSTNDFSTLYITQVNSTRGNIAVNIPIQAGEVIGILGSRQSDNSRSNQNNETIVNGDTIQLTTLGFPGQLTTTAPYNISSFPLSTNISRVNFEYSSTNVCINPNRTEVTAVVLPTYLTEIDTAACDSFTISNGSTYYFNQIVYDTLQSVNLCDSVIKYTLSLNSSSFDSIEVVACDSFVAPSGNVFFASTMFYDTSYYASGCPNAKFIDLTVSYSSVDTASITSCNQFATPMGAVLTTDTFFAEMQQSVNSCDSLVYFDVTINPNKFTVDTVHACNTYTTLSGVTYDTSTIYYDSLQTTLSCDSLVQVVLVMNYSTLDSLVEVHCDAYISPNGTVRTQSAIFYDTLTTVYACDSVIFVNLTINNSTTESLAVTTCDTYTSPAGDLYTASAMFADTLQTSDGCDSIINVDLTINYSTQENIYPVVCDEYTSPLGNLYNSSSIFTEVLSTALGCDSVLTVFLTVNEKSVEGLDIIACDSYTSPAGNLYTSNAVFSDTLTNTFGCDSILNVDLTIVNSTFEVLNETACDQFTSPLGNLYTSSQTIFDTLQSAFGCDSVLQIDLIVYQSIYDTIYQTVCVEYTSGGQITYDSTGVYIESYTSAEACDSIVTIVLEVDALILTVNKEDDLLESLDFGSSYQWINCTTGEVLSGETNRQFIAPANESYAVIVDNASCMDTSDCVMVNSIGTGIFWIENIALNFYPNPANEVLMISSSDNLDNIQYILVDLKGSIVGQGVLNGKLNRVPVNHLDQGMYFIQIESKAIPILIAD